MSRVIVRVLVASGLNGILLTGVWCSRWFGRSSYSLLCYLERVMPVLGGHPLTTDAGLFLDMLGDLVPGPRYAAYIRDQEAPCDTVYMVGWYEDGTLVGCVEMGVTPLQMVATEDVARVVGFFRYCVGTGRTGFGSNWMWERWKVFEETGEGLRRVAGV